MKRNDSFHEQATQLTYVVIIIFLVLVRCVCYFLYVSFFLHFSSCDGTNHQGASATAISGSSSLQSV